MTAPVPTTEELLRRADKAQRPDGRVYLASWLPVIAKLRRKNWPWAAIHEWLLEQGAPVQQKRKNFIVSASRLHHRALAKAALRDSENQHSRALRERSRK